MIVNVKITDNEWFNYIKDNKMTEVNFWMPAGRNINYEVGELVLFKQHCRIGDDNAQGLIVGGGFAKDFYIKPINEVWESLGQKNAVETKEGFYNRIIQYRKNNGNEDNDKIEVGCLILEGVFCFKEGRYIDAEKEIKDFTWSKSIVTGKIITDESVKESLIKAIITHLA